MNWSKLRAWPRKYLWQAPRGFVLKVTRNSDAMMREMIAGKSVAIVGNAASLFGAGHGAAIDQHDIIIRMNKGVVTDPHSQGHRTDIITLTPELTEAETVKMFQPKLFLFLIPKLRHFRFYDPNNLRRTAFYAYRYWLSDRNKIGRRPSSGYMIISYVLRLNCAKSVTLYGFDFGATPTFYNPDGYKTPHNFGREREIIAGLAHLEKIRIA